MAALHRPVYAARLKTLTRLITPHIQAADKVLDVGCGTGNLTKALSQAPNCPQDATFTGLERVRRGGEPIEVVQYDGTTFPFDDNSFDVVILADVLHHEQDPGHLLAECKRVTRRLLIIKDHQRRGLLAQQRISLIDWAANAPYGVPCLYRYNTRAQWTRTREELALDLVEEHNAINLYPMFYNILFGRSLQYLGIWNKSEPRPSSPAPAGEVADS